MGTEFEVTVEDVAGTVEKPTEELKVVGLGAILVNVVSVGLVTPLFPEPILMESGKISEVFTPLEASETLLCTDEMEEVVEAGSGVMAVGDESGEGVKESGANVDC